MPVEVHVTGRVELGRFAEFAEAVRRWSEFRASRGEARARVLHGLSGEMNHVRLVFTYPDIAAYEREEARDSLDPEYARLAGGMPFVDGTLEYAIYRELDK
jgi:hypothetical protein